MQSDDAVKMTTCSRVNLTMLFQRERAICVCALWLRWKQSALKKERSARPSWSEKYGQRLNNWDNSAREHLFFSVIEALSYNMKILISKPSLIHVPKENRVVADGQSGDDDFSEERLDHDCEVSASVVPAGFHKVVQHKLKEKRRSKCLISWHESWRSSWVQPDIFCWAPRASETPPSLMMAEQRKGTKP